MDKRYQVFVSSTYTDLLKERNAVMHALLKMKCMPSGMELFPATNKSQWLHIERSIDECDYYLIILAGRYGSIDGDTGKSFTELEYDYAIRNNKPVLAFVHKAPDDLPGKRLESDDVGRRLFKIFREKITRNRLVQFWTTADNLGACVLQSLGSLISDEPAVGWVRASEVADLNELRQRDQAIEDLGRQVVELSSRLSGTFADVKTMSIAPSPRVSSDDLAHEVRSLIDQKQSARLHELIMSLASSVRHSLVSDCFHFVFPASRDGYKTFVQDQVKLYEDAISPLLQAVFTGVYHSGDGGSELWKNCVESVVNARGEQRPSPFNDTLWHLSFYPATLAFTAATYAAFCAGHFKTLRALLSSTMLYSGARSPISDDGGRFHPFVQVWKYEMREAWNRYVLGGTDTYTPISDRLCTVTGQLAKSIYLNERKHQMEFDKFEYFCGLVESPNKADLQSLVPVGSFFWRYRQRGGPSRDLASEIIEESEAKKASTPTWAPLLAGFFGGKKQRLLETIESYETELVKQRQYLRPF